MASTNSRWICLNDDGEAGIGDTPTDAWTNFTDHFNADSPSDLDWFQTTSGRPTAMKVEVVPMSVVTPIKKD